MPAKNNQTTILTVLVVLQIVAIGFLFARVVNIDENIANMATVEQGQATKEAVSQSPRGADPGQAAEFLSAEQVRQIVREELRAQISTLASGAGTTDPDSTTAPDPYDEIEYQQQYALVDQELEFFINQGTISDADMAALQQEIARLDPEGREEMLRRLVQALNSGELDGRL